MIPVSEQYNNFLGGITSELRANYEIPKFARLWNFDVTTSRAIQHYGLKSLIVEQAHLVEYEPANVTLNKQWFLSRHSVLAVRADGNVTFIDTECGHPTTTLTLESDVEMATLPIMYRGHLVWLDTDYNVWLKPLFPSVLPAFQVLTGLTPDEANVRNTFFQASQDGKLYIFSGKRVHRVEVPSSTGNFNSGSELAPFQPITQFMQSPNRNGNVGTYTGLSGPETQIITQIDEVQSILWILGYYTGAIDGVFGPATSTAVSAFQADYNATGNVPGGQPAGAPLVIDGIIGPETQSVLNSVDEQSNQSHRERKNVLVLPNVITAVCENGGVINIATANTLGDATVYYWDKSLSAEGFGDIGLLTSCVVGKGVVQVLRPLQGRLMAIMTPATDSFCLHKYVKMSIFAIQAGFDMLPESYAVPVAEYNLRLGPDGSTFDQWRFNIINQKSIVSGSRLYFTGQINLQGIQKPTDNDGVFSGVMSIDYNGNLFTELAFSETDEDLTQQPVVSFAMVDSGFLLASDERVYITDKNFSDNVSGLITKIINGDKPWVYKQIDNIYLSMANYEDVSNVQILVRDIENVDDAGGGWQLAYDGNLQGGNNVTINKLEDGQPFWQFKEIQVMVLIRGINAELNNLTINYNILEDNK